MRNHTHTSNRCHGTLTGWGQGRGRRQEPPGYKEPSRGLRSCFGENQGCDAGLRASTAGKKQEDTP